MRRQASGGCDDGVNESGTIARLAAGRTSPLEGDSNVAFRLIPREERFYDDFVALANELERGARGLGQGSR